MADGRGRAEVVVVGLGLVGAAALRHLAAAGVDVVGIGPGEPPDWSAHQGVFASHYDSGRITRKLDVRFEWAELATRSIAAYPTIREQSGVAFHHPVGTVFASPDPAHIAALVEVANRVGADHRVLGPAADVPFAGGRLAVPPGSLVVAEPAPAGFIDPSQMLRAQLGAASAHRARVVTETVVAIEPAGGGWRVTTTEGTTTTAPRVLVATGAHTDELGVGSRFTGTVRPETVVLATIDDTEQERLAGLPSVLAHHLVGGSFADLYQVPPTTYPDGTVRLKLGATLRQREPLVDHEARRAWMAGDAHGRHLDELRGLVEDLVPGIRATAWETKPCMITDTPSGLPSVDHLAPGLVVAAGGNGYAAKSADAIGALAATLLVEGGWTDPVLDPTPFRAAP